MVYECEGCGKALPPGVTACPSCGEKFGSAVLADALPTAGTSSPRVDPVQPPQAYQPLVTAAPPMPPAPTRTEPWKGGAGAKPPGWNSRIPAPLLWMIGAGFFVFILILLAQPRESAPASGEHAAAAPVSVQKPPAPARRFASHATGQHRSRLSRGQVNSGFKSLRYARAYDRFGREIMRRDRDVKEVAASERDSASGFYVIVRDTRLPAGSATSRARRFWFSCRSGVTRSRAAIRLRRAQV